MGSVISEGPFFLSSEPVSGSEESLAVHACKDYGVSTILV